MNAFPNSIVPRWLIVLIDLGIVLLSLFISYQLRFDFDVPENEVAILRSTFLVFILIRLGTMLVMRLYAGIIRYTSTEDSLRILKTTALGSILIFAAGLIRHYGLELEYILPTTVLLLELVFTSFLMIAYRVGVKLVYLEASNPRREKSKVLIYGAGEAGIITKRTLDRDAGTKYEVVAFIDDDRSKSSKKLEGSPIHHPDKLEALLKKNDISELIISMMVADRKNRQRVLDICLENGVRVLDVPPVKRWINGELSFNQLRPVRIEDLLQREEIALDTSAIATKIADKCVLVSGAAGSIGSELVRQIADFSPGRIILLEQAESPLHDIALEMGREAKDVGIEVVLGDVRNRSRMRRLMEAYRPEVIYHAAAYKHVPLVEENPTEGVLTNVQGSKVMADLADEFEVDTFVLISTDKAVNPTNVMGASKRVAEMYVQALDAKSRTDFITTRFGNVLGSSGSVIPLFKKQIEEGGPITVTHESVSRFFMTIPEACRLVLEASAKGKGGEIYVFDMGKAVRIIDLAKKMITLSGLQEGRDIMIEVTGLRPGEKLYEEVLADEENTKPTHHPKILIADTRPMSFSMISTQVDTLLKSLDDQENERTVAMLKEMVPEFKSNNSIYEKLDKK